MDILMYLTTFTSKFHFLGPGLPRCRKAMMWLQSYKLKSARDKNSPGNLYS